MRGRNKRRELVRIAPAMPTLFGRPGCEVTVSGRVSENMRILGRAYLHMPSPDPNIPPRSIDACSFAIDADGRFEFQLCLPISASGGDQTWYVEVRVEPASAVIPLRISAAPAAAAQYPPPSPTRIASGAHGEKQQTARQQGPPPAPDAERSGDATSQTGDKMRRHSEGVVKSTPMKIGGHDFERAQVDEVVSMLEREDRVVLTGDRGSGKTVIMCKIYKKLEGRRRVLLARCDDFLQCKSVDDMDMLLNGNTSITEHLGGALDGPKAVVLFDSLDAAARSPGFMQLFRQFIERLWSTRNVQTVFTARTYDYQYSPAIGTDQWGARVAVGDLTAGMLQSVLDGVVSRTVPDELKAMLRNPLRLKIFHMIASKSPDADFAEIKTEARLYREHWRVHVDKDDRRDNMTAALLDAAKRMIESRRTALLRHSLAGPPDGLDGAYSNGILSISGEHARFFHTAYMDYVGAMDILLNRPDIAAFLEADPHNAFVIPTIGFALSIMHDGDRTGYLRTVASICGSSLPRYWKVAALQSLAGLDCLSEAETEAVARILSGDADILRHFLLEAGRAANPFWLRAWSDSLMLEWSSQPGSARILLSYLESLPDRADHRESMMRLAAGIVDNDRIHPTLRQRAVMATARISAPSKADWYVALSRHPDPLVRRGVLHCLEGILDADKDKATEAFANVLAHGEAPGIGGEGAEDRGTTAWEASELFPALLKKNPAAMIRAAVRIFESANAAYRDGGDLVEDHSRIQHSILGSSPRYKMIASIEDALPDLLARNRPAFAAILSSSWLAMFHRMLLDALASRPDRFKDAIYDELSRPSALIVPSLRESAREAVRLVSPLLSERQVDALLARIMALGKDADPAHRRRGSGDMDGLKAYYLSAFDRSALSAEHLALVDRHPPPPPPADRALMRGGFAPIAAPPDDAQGALPTPGQAVNLLLGRGAGRIDLDLLELAAAHAGTGAVPEDGSGLASQMRRLFLGLAGDPDPREGVPCERNGYVVAEPSVRGLAAKGST